MKNKIRPLYLILGGLAAIFAGNLAPESVYMQALGTVGLLVFIIGIINGIVGLVKKGKKAPPAPPTDQKQS